MNGTRAPQSPSRAINSPLRAPVERATRMAVSLLLHPASTARHGLPPPLFTRPSRAHTSSPRSRSHVQAVAQDVLARQLPLHELEQIVGPARFRAASRQ